MRLYASRVSSCYDCYFYSSNWFPAFIAFRKKFFFCNEVKMQLVIHSTRITDKVSELLENVTGVRFFLRHSVDYSCQSTRRLTTERIRPQHACGYNRRLPTLFFPPSGDSRQGIIYALLFTIIMVA